MVGQNNNQVNQQLTKEELTKTQVLNLTDLENVAKYEKKVSKKPALILAVIGMLCIFSGFTYMGIANVMNKRPETGKSAVYRKEVPEEDDNTITCNYSQLGNADGTDIVVKMKLNLEDGKLQNYEKTMTVMPTEGNEAVGMPTIQVLLPAYQAFEPMLIPGYTIKSLPEKTGFKTEVKIDLTQLDVTLLTAHQANVSTKVEFSLNDTKSMIMTKASTLGYLCQ